MTRYAVPAASALLIAAIITELYNRVVPGQYFALFALCVAGVFMGAWVGSRTAARRPATLDSGRRPAKSTRATAKPQQRSKANGDRESGEVKWFNRNKGFGFIIRDAGGEIFVHHRSITDRGLRSLRDGQRVSFDVVEHEKGLQAESVSVVD